MGRLYLGGIDLAHDPPGRTIREAEQEDGDDDDPSGDSKRVHRTCSIEGADQEHDA